MFSLLYHDGQYVGDYYIGNVKNTVPSLGSRKHLFNYRFKRIFIVHNGYPAIFSTVEQTVRVVVQ
jgi:hypothetical protein